MDPSHIDLSNGYIQFLVVSTILVGIITAAYERRKFRRQHEHE